MDAGSFADWVAAVGSLSAVGASYYLHRQSVSERRQLERSQARSAAMILLPLFREANRDFAWTGRQLAAGWKPDNLGTDENRQTIDVGDLARHQRLLLAHVPTMALMGATSAVVQAAYVAIEKLADELGRYGVGADPDDWIYVGPAWPDTEAHFRYTETLVARATSEIERLAANVRKRDVMRAK